ncbi:MAG: hypothetical protein NC094_13940 [Bacteroidales bacterium]|nr:hypothetical protein [Lachnoclostridium sp.]MCM1466503.1 hypothetical protein [Bacteroidales bacterium]
MKYIGMWALFKKSFEHNLNTEFGLDRNGKKAFETSGQNIMAGGTRNSEREYLSEKECRSIWPNLSNADHYCNRPDSSSVSFFPWALYI